MERKVSGGNTVAGGNSGQPGELTETELDLVSGGATGRRVELPIEISTPVGTATAGPTSVDIFQFVAAFGSK